jgi:hypothetical protein
MYDDLYFKDNDISNYLTDNEKCKLYELNNKININKRKNENRIFNKNSYSELKQIIKEAIQESLPKKKMTLTLEECVKESGIGRSTLLELVHSVNTDFPYFRVGKKIFINRDKLSLWLDKISDEHKNI